MEELILPAVLLLILVVGVPTWLMFLLGRTLAKPPDRPWPGHLLGLAPEWCLWLVLSVPLTLLLLPAPGGGGPTRGMICTNNLKQIALALLNYQDANGSYPPAFTTDAQGRPLHSWRVLILPYLEQQRLYDALRLDEPWDSEHNRSVIEEAFQGATPDVYRCPSEENDSTGDTSYVLLVGPGTISDNGSCTRFEQVTDGLSRTALVVEMADSGIHWMEPRELDVRTMSYKINDRDAPSIRSHHAGVAEVAIADGSVHAISEDSDPDDVKALTTIAAGDDFGKIFD